MKATMLALLFCATVLFAATPATEDTEWISDLGGSVTRNALGQVTGVNLRGTWGRRYGPPASEPVFWLK